MCESYLVAGKSRTLAWYLVRLTNDSGALEGPPTIQDESQLSEREVVSCAETCWSLRESQIADLRSQTENIVAEVAVLTDIEI